jgi:ubiquitin carboxyl-terminal hydrolase 25
VADWSLVGKLSDPKSVRVKSTCDDALVISPNLYSIPVVSQLAGLFSELEHCLDPSVTPTIELAKLALVTSKDEEEDDVDRNGTDSSNDTDATLVEDAPSRLPASETPAGSPGSGEASSSSVLGKRGREQGRRSEDIVVDMDVDGGLPISRTESDKDAFVMVSKPSSPRPSEQPGKKTASESVMMFGASLSFCM